MPSASSLFPLLWGPTSLYLSYPFISSSGGYVFKLGKTGFDAHSVGLDTRGSVAAFRFMRDLSAAGRYKLVPVTVSDVVAKDLFEAGKVAMYIGGSWDASFMRQRGIALGAVPVPGAGSHRARPFATLHVFVVNRFSGHPNESFSLLQYLSRHLGPAEYRLSNELPVTKADLSSPSFRQDPVTGGLARAAMDAQAVPNVTAMTVVWGVTNATLTQMIRRRLTPEQAAHQMATTIRANVARAGG